MVGLAEEWLIVLVRGGRSVWTAVRVGLLLGVLLLPGGLVILGLLGLALRRLRTGAVTSPA